MSDKLHNVNARRGTITITTPAANGTVTHVLNGEGKWVNFTTANMEDTDSTNFVITDEFGGTVFTSGTKAESTTFSIGSTFPMYGTVKFIAVGEGTQSVSRSVPYSVIYEE